MRVRLGRGAIIVVSSLTARRSGFRMFMDSLLGI